MKPLLYLKAAGFLGDVEHVEKEGQGDKHQHEQVYQRAHRSLREVESKDVGSRSTMSEGISGFRTTHIVPRRTCRHEFSTF